MLFQSEWMHRVWENTRRVEPVKEAVGAETVRGYIVEDKNLLVVSQTYPRFSVDDWGVAIRKLVMSHRGKIEIRYSADPCGTVALRSVDDRTVIVPWDGYTPSKARRYDIRKEKETGEIHNLSLGSMNQIRDLWNQHPFKSYDISHLVTLLTTNSFVKAYGYYQCHELKAFTIFLCMYPELFYWLGTGGHQSCLVDYAARHNVYDWLDMGGARREEALMFKKQFGGGVVNYRRWIRD